eukprot:10715697-Heterocapsa_arctica.AAC.1
MVDSSLLERKPRDGEVVVCELNVITGKTVFTIQRDLPILTKEDEQNHQAELLESMAGEWKSWADHDSFVPILRGVARNVIDARW